MSISSEFTVDSLVWVTRLEIVRENPSDPVLLRATYRRRINADGDPDQTYADSEIRTVNINESQMESASSGFVAALEAVLDAYAPS